MSFHQVYLCQSKPKALESLHRSISRPVLVLWTRVVEVIWCGYKRGQEDAGGGASPAFRDGWQPRSEAGEVDQRGHQGRDLHGRLVDQRADELFKGR